MLEWNTFIKPLVYVIEVIFAVVVTAGTADKLLFYDSDTVTTRCALNDSIPACAVVISLGSLCICGSFYVLWKRLSSVFLCESKYSHNAESAMCLLLTLGWLSISSVITAYNTHPANLAREFLRTERIVTITFAWLLCFFHLGSVAIAWFAPDEDYQDDYGPPLSVDHATLEYPLAIPLAQPLYPSISTPAFPTLNKEQLSRPSESTPQLATPQYGDLAAFLDQNDQIEPGRQSSQFIATPSSIAGPSPLVGPQLVDGARQKESIEDLASAWKQIVSADLDASSPHVDISMSASPSLQNDNAEIPSVTLTAEAPASQSTLRRRTVRFFESLPEPRRRDLAKGRSSARHRSA